MAKVWSKVPVEVAKGTFWRLILASIPEGPWSPLVEYACSYSWTLPPVRHARMQFQWAPQLRELLGLIPPFALPVCHMEIQVANLSVGLSG